MPLENRIIDLESRLAFQDKLIAELDGVIREFADRVEVLEDKAKEAEANSIAAPSDPVNERPPHY